MGMTMHGIRLLSVSAIAGAAAMAAATGATQAAQWSDLNSWQGFEEQKIERQQTPFEREVASAFQNLGMSEARADCYGRVLQIKLKPKHRDETVQLLQTSSDASDVRHKVISHGFDIMGGFRNANEACPETLGS